MLVRRSRAPRATVCIAVIVAGSLTLAAQTKVVPPHNRYSPADDVMLGQQAAAQARHELPLLDDPVTQRWVARVGDRLVAAIPAEFQQTAFRYTFEHVNQREINAFALPGGPMFLNRGMIEAAGTEGEVAGVMGHELAHVFLRHGTAQATRGERFQLGAIAGQVLGAIIGGTAGSLIAQGSQFGLGAYFLRFSREYETQADIMGAQLLARAGYDPREMAAMFRTIQGESRGNGPEWLSSHPDPGNRVAAIRREAQHLRVQRPLPPSDEFRRVRARLSAMPPAYTANSPARPQRAH